MVAVLLATLLAVQEPRVSATVDRTEAMVGDVITLSIRVEGAGEVPVRVVNPVLSGFELRGTREATRVQIRAGRTERTYTRELRLVAARPGTATIGPVRVRQGDRVVETASIVVSVTAPAAGIAPTLAPGLRALVDSVRPPTGAGAEGVAVEVRALPDSVVLGAQLDLVTLAWFPRDVRTQLRTPPTLSPPEVEGVWSYRQTTPSGIVASRRVGGRWYDLFVNHQVLFPLTPGTVRIGPATVSYVLPLTYSFLSRELQHESQSESMRVIVSAPPSADRPAGFAGAAGSGIALGFEVEPTTLRAGGAATATVTLAGEGNVALWPEPDVRWPAGVRVYPGDVTVDLAPRDGLVAGEKRFTYLVVPDSGGVHTVPDIRYPYFDPGAGRYVVATGPGARMLAHPTPLAAARLEPPALLRPDAAARWWGALDRVPLFVWLVLGALPPVAVLAVRLARRRGRAPGRGRDAVPVHIAAGPLEELDHEFRAVLARLVRDPAQAEGPGLEAALRAAGLDPALAAHALRVRDRLQRAVFGPAAVTDPEELTAEARELLRALAGETPASARAWLAPLAVALALVVPGVAGAQAAPEQLYEAGAVRAAADSFLLRASAEPDVAAHWYNLGSAFYRLGEVGRARVAWTRAARLAPRHASIRRALDLLGADPTTRSLTWPRRVTAGEAALVATLAWCAALSLVAFGRARPLAWGLIGVALLAGGVAVRVRLELQRPVAVALEDGVPLRAAPYGSADAVRSVVAGSAVRIERIEGRWLLVRRGEARGWVHRAEVARL